MTPEYGVPSTSKFKLSNFVAEHAIVIFEHAIMIFQHAIVQLKYEIRNGMLILLFNMKPLIGLFKANNNYHLKVRREGEKWRHIWHHK